MGRKKRLRIISYIDRLTFRRRTKARTNSLHCRRLCLMSRRESPINRSVLWEKIGYKPHGAAQMEFHDSNSRFRAAVCGRRFGKSTMAAVDLIEDCFIPDSYYWICGPTYKLAEKEFRIVRNAFTDRRKLNMLDKIKSS